MSVNINGRELDKGSDEVIKRWGLYIVLDELRMKDLDEEILAYRLYKKAGGRFRADTPPVPRG